MDNLKQCTKCKEWKPRYEFSANKSTKDGLQLHCKTCQKIRYQENKEIVLERVKRYRTSPQGKAQIQKWKDENKDYLRDSKKAWYENNKEHAKEYTRQFTQDNPDYQRQWNEKNKERIKEIQRRGYQRNKESKNARHRQWYRSNRDHAIRYAHQYRQDKPGIVKLASRRWQQNNPHKMKALRHLYRSRKRQASGAFTG